MIKESVHHKGMKLNLYPPNSKASKYMKQILTEVNREIDHNTIMIGISISYSQ